LEKLFWSSRCGIPIDDARLTPWARIGCFAQANPVKLSNQLIFLCSVSLTCRLHRSLPVPIKVTCNSCGKSLKAKDSAAGKRVKCPQCGDPISIPDEVYDAEEAGGDDDYSGYDDDYGDGQYDLGDDVANAPGATKRRPCPACGEMIVEGAAKCRFCGEIFDAALKRKARKSKSGGSDDADMTTGDWVVACLCSGIGCIAGIVWMIQGKPKGSKMLGVSFLMAIFWNVVKLVLTAAMEAN
jgi:predicted RNA-binding Zn-ribbon protein involved in translation (DUF1610 family)